VLFKCPLCNFTCKSITRLKFHFRTKHLNKGLNVCPACGKTFETSIRLTIHVMAKKDEKHKPYHYLFYNPRASNIKGLRKKMLRENAEKYFKVGDEEK